MPLWDAFMLRDELDMLEMRLTELQHIEGLTHVIVEADIDFQQNPKPLHYLENRERFAPWKDRIRHFAAEGLPENPPGDLDAETLRQMAWKRENAQRNWCMAGLEDAWPDDTVLIGDVDEIPAADLITAPLTGPGFVHHVRHMTFAVDWENPVEQLCTVVVRRKQIHSFTRSRDLKYWMPRKRGGWHFSWLGGPEAIEAKNAACAHTEHKAKVAEGNAAGRLYEAGWCPWMGDGVQLKPVDMDPSWPRYIRARRCPQVWFRPRENEAEATREEAFA